MIFRAKNAYLTCADRDDGGGAQIAACVSTMILARLRGLTYAHTPLSNVAHAPPGMSPGEWAAAWENFFNPGLGEVPAADLSHLRSRKIRRGHRFLARSNTLHSISHAHKITDRHPQEWASIAPQLREKYHASPKPDVSSPGDPRPVIAIHLRRGDVSATGRFSERYTADESVLSAIRSVTNSVGREHRVEIFSQGKPEDFAAFEPLEPVLRLDEDPFVSFHRMSRADILFTAKSTFSYLAGILGTGAIVYEDFWHPPLPDWIPFSKLGEGDPGSLLRRRQ